MENDMLERVANAVRDNIRAALPDGVALDYEYAARAAIEAMRDPSGNAKGAGELAFLKRRNHASHLAVPAIWGAMIDAAVGRPA